MPIHTQTLVATLGGQPQVVTFTLDLLLQRGFDIHEVIVLHPDPGRNPSLQESLSHLYKEFANDLYHPQGGESSQPCHFRSQVLHLNNQPLPDITDEISVNATRDTIQKLIGELKRQQRKIHLSISGGRRLISLVAASIAIFNFDYEDAIWHIYTPDNLQEHARGGQIMHAPPEAGVRLIPEPFVPLGAFIAVHEGTYARQLSQIDHTVDKQERQRCQQVIEHLSLREREVLKAFAQGLRPQEVASRLVISPKTVDSHKTKILAECCIVWGRKSGSLTYNFIEEAFIRYFQEPT